MSGALNDRSRDHPISPSTLTGMATSARTGCQHALFMLRWLGRTLESFLTGSAGARPEKARFALPTAGPDRHGVTAWCPVMHFP